MISASARTVAWRLGRKLYCWARRDVPNNPDTNGEYWLLDELAAVVQDDALLFDVGANVGEWTRRALSVTQRAGRTVSVKVFEPCSTTRLRLGAELAGLSSVEVFPYAVSSADGEADFFSSGPGAGTNSLNVVSGPLRERVPVVALDTFLAQHGVEHIAMLKIDTEGFDLGVLQGATRTLAEGRIDVVQFEYNWRWLLNKASLLDVFTLVQDMPYRVGKLVGHDIEFFDVWHAELDRFFETNYVLVRKGGPLAHLGRTVDFDGSNCVQVRHGSRGR